MLQIIFHSIYNVKHVCAIWNNPSVEEEGKMVSSLYDLRSKRIELIPIPILFLFFPQCHVSLQLHKSGNSSGKPLVLSGSRCQDVNLNEYRSLVADSALCQHMSNPLLSGGRRKELSGMRENCWSIKFYCKDERNTRVSLMK